MTGNVVDDARGLLEGGRVAAAREKLLLAPEKNSAAAMLVLARSYDPNVLQSIPGPDAGADVAEAERWYRRWREIATSEGLAIDPERFERIIRAMRRRGLSE